MTQMGVFDMAGKVVSRLQEVRAEWQQRHGQTVSWEKVSEDTGIAHSTLLRWASNKTNRYDDKVMATLCEYFGVKPGDILDYVPDEE